MPVTIAPAAVRWSTAVADTAGTDPNAGHPAVVSIPATSMLSFTANGTPPSTPIAHPAGDPFRIGSDTFEVEVADPHRSITAGVDAGERRLDHLPHRELAGAIAVEQPGDRVRNVVAHTPSDASRAEEWATAPNTPPCIVTIFSAAR